MIWLYIVLGVIAVMVAPAAIALVGLVIEAVTSPAERQAEPPTTASPQVFGSTAAAQNR